LARFRHDIVYYFPKFKIAAMAHLICSEETWD